MVLNMAKEPSRHNKDWTPAETRELRDLANGNTPTRVIVQKLKRTEDAVRRQASKKSISLKPVNQPPYNRQK